MNEKITLKDIVFFIIVILMAVGCIVIKLHESREVAADSKKQEKVVFGIHVKGEVKAPGYYELEYGSRVKDAIDAAGGAGENADVDGVNLAEKLRDGQEVTVPSKAAAENKAVSDGKVNINTANVYELCSLDGIGETLAKDIIAYRETKGAFKKTTDLKKIPGIGAGKFNKIKDRVKVGD